MAKTAAVKVEIDQTAILDLMDELRPLIQGYLSDPDPDSQTEIIELLNSIYGYILNCHSTQRKIKARRL